MFYINTISISQLKINPSKAIEQAGDYPLAIENRNKIKGYLIGKDLHEEIVKYIENLVDREVLKNTNFNEGKDFEEVVKKLGL